ncbi:hypothetical protein BaRGS_00009341 [Batillaria attramentaria]|uniref:Uncharacterized protein n=1 Tax=Batillaria attramentaria TaxID=370345 RepID=A0ABD0LJJ9_9CAEN
MVIDQKIDFLARVGLCMRQNVPSGFLDGFWLILAFYSSGKRALFQSSNAPECTKKAINAKADTTLLNHDRVSQK